MQQPQQQPRAGSRRRRSGQKAKPLDLWRPVAPLPPVEPIAPSDDPTALLRSLGDPPLQGQGAQAMHNLALVVVRASGLATALAAAGGLLADVAPAASEDAGSD